MVSLTNSVFTLGDGMDQLEPERLRLLEFALAPIGGLEKGRPVKFATNGMPVAMCLGNDRPWEHWTTAALFNFRDQPQEPEFDPSEFSLNTSDWHHLFNPLTGEYYGKNPHRWLSPQNPPANRRRNHRTFLPHSLSCNHCFVEANTLGYETSKKLMHLWQEGLG